MTADTTQGRFASCSFPCVNVLLSEKECPVSGEHKNRKGGLQNEDLENGICIEQETKKQQI